VRGVFDVHAFQSAADCGGRGGSGTERNEWDCVMDLVFRPSCDKAVQALNFFARKSGDNRVNKMKALKLVFFADRYHLRRYGRPIVGDRYVAMLNGPVPSLAKDLAESTEYLAVCDKEYADRFLSRTTGNLTVISLAPVDEDVFSDSDLEALDFAWTVFGGFGEFELRDITHAYPEWSKHKESIDGSSRKRSPMAYEDFFANADPTDPLLARLGARDPFEAPDEDLEVARECAEERAAVESIWGR
jgi:uncharacterized phage-associated protein